jgi:hypothetical protein
MEFQDNKKMNRILRWGSKVLLLGILLLIAFSPLGQLIQTSKALAATAYACKAGDPPPEKNFQTGVWNCFPAGGGFAYAPTGDTPPESTGDDWTTTLADAISYVVYIFTVGLGSALAYVASFFFNIAVFFSLNSTSYALNFITTGWTLVRDLANMAFIFILVYIAMKVVFRAETNGTLALLVRVVTIALIINFSFFFARLIIDGGNILAVEFYNINPSPALIDSASAAGAPGGAQAVTNLTSYISDNSGNTKDLTAGLMNTIKIQKILGTESFAKFTKGSPNFLSKVISLSFIYICVGVIFAMLAAMFFTIGVKFISRVVVLWLVIIAAPLALVMYAIPSAQAKGYFDQWRKALVTYSLYPAVFLFLYLIIIMFAYELAGCQVNQIANCQTTIIDKIFDNIPTGDNVSPIGQIAVIITETVFRLGFIMMLLYLAMKASDAVSNMGGTLAQKISGSPTTAFTGRFMKGLGNLGYRNTAGRAAQVASGRLANSSLANSRWINNPVFGHPTAAIRQRLDKAADKSFGGGLSRTAYDKQYGAREAERLNTVKTIETARALGKFDRNNPNLDRDLSDPQLARLKELEKKAFDNMTDTELAETTALKSAFPDKRRADLDRLKSERDVLAERARAFGKPQLEALKAGDIEQILKHITESQIKILKDSNKFDTKTKDDWEKKWYDTSKNSPTHKANEQIQLLRKIHETLKTDGHTLTLLESKIGSEKTPTHGIVTAKDVGNFKEELNTNIESIRDDIRKTPKTAAAELAGYKTALKNFQKTLEHLNSLETNIKNIPQDKGGTKESQSLDTSTMK